jgi:hypothetical protein
MLQLNRTPVRRPPKVCLKTPTLPGTQGHPSLFVPYYRRPASRQAASRSFGGRSRCCRKPISMRCWRGSASGCPSPSPLKISDPEAILSSFAAPRGCPLPREGRRCRGGSQEPPSVYLDHPSVAGHVPSPINHRGFASRDRDSDHGKPSAGADGRVTPRGRRPSPPGRASGVDAAGRLRSPTSSP